MEKEEGIVSDKSNQRITWIDTLKGIGIILVVVGHISWNNPLSYFLYSFHLALFFFASGYTHKSRPVKKDLAERSRKILIPYFFFGFLELIYWQIFERRFRITNFTFLQGLEGLIFGKYSLLKFNVHLWYLPCFFLCVLILNVLTENKHHSFLTISAIVISILYIFLPLPIQGWPEWKNSSGWSGLPELPWEIDRIPKYFLFLVIGYLIRNYIGNENTVSFLKKRYCIAYAFLTMLIVFLISKMNLNEFRAFWYLSGLLGIIGISVFSYKLESSRILQYLGKESLVILCTHGPIYGIICELFSVELHIEMDIIRRNLLWIIIVTIITLFLCSGINEILSRFLPWSVGERRK